LAGVTFALFMTASRQFLPPHWQRALLCIGLIQFSAAAIAILSVDSFVVMVVNYAPVLLVFLILNHRHRHDGKGSRDLAVGLLILAVGSGVQALARISHTDLIGPPDWRWGEISLPRRRK
jgi:hypothetical protein